MRQQSALSIFLLLLGCQLVAVVTADDGQNVRLPARFGKRMSSSAGTLSVGNEGESSASSSNLMKMLMHSGQQYSGSNDVAQRYISEATVPSNGVFYMLVPMAVKGNNFQPSLKHSSADAEAWK